ncbi:hypothetical protein V1264_012671 [Littorina saxatilis]|uniref:Cyclin-F n=1 Tax=Littorina saxatilis TaxID=31220 RepID=A0AAN9GLV9_9CAEN
MQQETGDQETQVSTRLGPSQMQRLPPDGNSAPQHGQYERPRTRSSFTVCHLSPELLVHVFKGVHIRDLLSLRQVCTLFHEVVDSSSCLWAHATFFNSWPLTEGNLSVFNKAAASGNFEASVKLAIAKLYNEGLSEAEKGISIEEKARQATDHFYQAERQTTADPFTWIFIRPPWASNGLSCKAYVFEAMKQQSEKEKSQKISRGAAASAFSIGNILTLMDDHKEADVYLERAVCNGSVEAQLMLWMNKFGGLRTLGKPSQTMESGRELEAMRQLRGIVLHHNSIKAKLWLCECYAVGRFGGITSQQAYSFTKEVFQSSTPVNFLPVLNPPHELNASMRYILVDWMVEVATMKNFSTQAIHNAVAIVNRCLMIHDFGRAQVQLLGISAMVICSRFLTRDIITIKEAAWLTDNTYTYSDVVRMMGEIMALLNGHIQFLTTSDLAHALEPVSGLTERGMCLVDYITELCMLQTNLAKYSPAEIGASCVLLARVLSDTEEVWPQLLENLTGFSRQDLTCCCFDIHEKCLLEGTQFDHRDFPMQAVKERYSDESSLFKVTEIKTVSQEDLKDKLGIVDPVVQKAKSRLSLRKAEELICSPSRGKGRSRRTSERMMERPSRDEASTPPVEYDALGGYEADYEDDTDPFDISFSSIRSEDYEYEPRTEPFSEPSSELDPLYVQMSNQCSNSYIPGWSQITFSSPFAPRIRVSNCSCRSCSTSGVGSSPALSTSSSQSPDVLSSQAKLLSSSAVSSSAVQSFSFTPNSTLPQNSAFTSVCPATSTSSSVTVTAGTSGSGLSPQWLGIPSARFYGHQSHKTGDRMEVAEDEDAREDDEASLGFSAADDLLSDEDDSHDGAEVREFCGVRDEETEMESKARDHPGKVSTLCHGSKAQLMENTQCFAQLSRRSKGLGSFTPIQISEIVTEPKKQTICKASDNATMRLCPVVPCGQSAVSEVVKHNALLTRCSRTSSHVALDLPVAESTPLQERDTFVIWDSGCFVPSDDAVQSTLPPQADNESTPLREDEGYVIWDGAEGVSTRRKSLRSQAQVVLKFLDADPASLQEEQSKVKTPVKAFNAEPVKRKSPYTDSHTVLETRSDTSRQELLGCESSLDAPVHTGDDLDLVSLQPKRRRRHSSRSQNS